MADAGLLYPAVVTVNGIVLLRRFDFLTQVATEAIKMALFFVSFPFFFMAADTTSRVSHALASSSQPASGPACHAEGTPRNCYRALHLGHTVSGIYVIDPRDGQGSFPVWCDMATDGGGWTVFQRRRDGSVDFYRDWEEYRSGFGDMNGEFWLGLDKTHRLATDQTLRFDLADFDNVKRYAHYDTFTIGPRSSLYVVYVGKYTGNAGDSFGVIHKGSKFSTKDKDNDRSDSNCAASYKGGWWYGSCHHSNLNGRYLKGQHSAHADGVNWL